MRHLQDKNTCTFRLHRRGCCYGSLKRSLVPIERGDSPERSVHSFFLHLESQGDCLRLQRLWGWTPQYREQDSAMSHESDLSFSSEPLIHPVTREFRVCYF